MYVIFFLNIYNDDIVVSKECL